MGLKSWSIECEGLVTLGDKGLEHLHTCFDKGTLIKLDRDRYLRFNLNSIRTLEKEYNISFDKLEEEFSMNSVQKILYVGLLKDDPILIFEEVGELVDMSNIQVVVESLAESLGGLQ